MARKKVDAVSESEEVLPEAPAEELEDVVPLSIAPLALDLGREDLNALTAKVNELVEWVNR